jgi:spore maturation protein CgeB
MRILIFDTCYPAFLASHYSERPELKDATYDVQWRALMDRFFGTSDAYSHFLGELGHEAREVVVNCRPLQSAWAREHRVRLQGGIWHGDRKVVLHEVEEFGPDVVYVQDLSVFGPRTLRALRARSHLLVGQIASAVPRRRDLTLYDLLLTSFPHFVGRFRDAGIASEYLRLGFDPRVLGHVRGQARTTGIVFIGALSQGPHAKGNELLERVAQRLPVDFWGYGADRWPRGSAIARRYRGEAWGLDMYRVLASSGIALNRHSEIAEDHANNMRLYEATGVGTLLITDAKSDLSDLFDPGDEVVTYASEGELVERIDHYLEHDTERRRIARAGQERTLREHTYRSRMSELVDILGRHLR